MTLDFLRPGLRLGYLIRGEYRAADGSLQVLRLVGPRAVVGTALVLSEPGPGPAGAVLWEGRCSGAKFDETLGGLDQTIQALSDLTLTIELGDPHGTGARADRDNDLRKDVEDGWWANQEVKAWLFDIDHPDRWEQVFGGRWDRNPDNVTPRGFSIVATGGILDPALRVPGSLLSDADQAGWTDVSTPGGNMWWPNTYHLHPHLSPGYRGLVWGNASGETDYIWIELLPYGTRGTSTYALVTGQPNAYVHEVFYESSTGLVVDVLGEGGVINTYLQDDPARGPLGTGVQFTSTGLASGNYAYNNPLVDLRCWGRVSGPDMGVNQDPVNLGNYRTNTGVSVRRVWDILELLFEDPLYLGLGNVFGTGAIAAFASSAPMGFFSDWIYGLCALPPEVVQSRPEMRDLLVGMLRPVGADLVQRWDPAAEELRLYPIWRGPRPGQTPDRVIREYDLRVKRPASAAMMDDETGLYANSIRVTSPAFYTAPRVAPEHQIKVEDKRDSVVNDAVEQGAARFNGVRDGQVDWELWLMHGANGYVDSAVYALDERSQRQRGMTGKGNYRLMGTLLGDVVRYDVPGVYDESGQARGRALNLELMEVTLRSVHIEVHADSGDRGD